MKRHPLTKDKEATFWHLVSEGAIEPERLPDFRRCERIGWPRAMIDALTTGKVKAWRNMRKKEPRIVIALEDFSYVVILTDRQDYVMLWTAYPVEYSHTRRKLEQEYAEALKNGLAAP